MEKKEKIKECISIMMIFGGELNRTVVVSFFFFFLTIQFLFSQQFYILINDPFFFYLILEFYRILFGEKWKRGREGGIGQCNFRLSTRAGWHSERHSDALMLALFLIVVALCSLLLLHLIYPRLVGLYSVLPLAWLVCNTYNTFVCIYFIYIYINTHTYTYVYIYINIYIYCVRLLRVTKIYIYIILSVYKQTLFFVMLFGSERLAIEKYTIYI